MGLPHRNYSVFKQTPFQLRRSKRKNKKKEQGQHQRIDIRRSIKKVGLRALKKWWKLEAGLAKRRALFPEGRGLGVGGRKKENVKVKAHGLRSMGLLFLNDAS